MGDQWRKGLEGKVVMVTGASSGIGRELCVDLARAGCRIIAAARRTDRLESLCDVINRAQPASSVPVALDVRAEEPAIECSVRKAWDAFGRIDALVNNAGVLGKRFGPRLSLYYQDIQTALHGPMISCLDMSEEDWKDVIKTNLTGLWLVSKHVCRLMCAAKQRGSVINISSAAAAGCGFLPGGVAYIASKSGVNAVTKMMAMEVGKHDIRVNAVAPGYFKSEITQSLMDKKWLSTFVSRTVPLRSYGTTDPALTSVVRYLIHDSSGYVSGNIFVVDAGTTLPGVPIFSSL